MAKSKWTQTKYPGIYKYELKSGTKYGIRVRYQDSNLNWKEKSASGFPTITAARKRKTELETTINKGMISNFDGDKVTFGQWYNEFLKMRIPIWSPETRYKVESCYRKHLIYFENVALTKITLIKYQNFINQKLFDEDLSLSSVKEYHRIFMSIINDAIKHEILLTNKLSKVTISKSYTPKEKILSQEEIKAFDELAKKDLKVMHLAVYTLLKIGWRSSEAMGLTKQAVKILPNGDVDLSVMIARTRCAQKGKSPKTSTSYRTNRLSGENAKIIIKAYEESERIHTKNRLNWNDKSFIFINENSLETYSHFFASQIIKKLSKKLNIKANAHMFRHTFASRAVASGQSIVEVSKWIGHGDVSMTLNNYSHSIGESRDKLIGFANS